MACQVDWSTLFHTIFGHALIDREYLFTFDDHKGAVQAIIEIISRRTRCLISLNILRSPDLFGEFGQFSIIS